MKNKAGVPITEEISWRDITLGGVVYEVGSAEHFRTGDWRSMKPVLLRDKCIDLTVFYVFLAAQIQQYL